MNRNFALLCSSIFTSSFGDMFRNIAVVLFVVESSQASPASSTATLLLNALPFFLLGPIAGAIADRFKKRSALIATDILRAFCSLGLVISAYYNLMPLFMAFVFLSSVIAVFFEPARFSIIPQLANKNDLTKANSIIQAGTNAIGIFAPLLASLVYFSFGAVWCFIIDALTFVISFVLIKFVKNNKESDINESGILNIKEMKRLYISSFDGIFVIAKSRMLQSFFGVAAGMTITSGVNQIALIFFITKDLKLNGAYLSVLFTANAVAQVLSAALLVKFNRRVSPVVLFVTSGFIVALTQLGIGLSETIFLAVSFVMIGSLANSPYDIAYDTVLQKHVKEELYGRVYSSLSSIGHGLQIIVFSLTGVLLLNHSAANIIAVSGVISICLVLAFGFVMQFKLKDKSVSLT